MKIALKPLVLALPLCSPMIFNHALAQESTIAGLVVAGEPSAGEPLINVGAGSAVSKSEVP